MKAVLFDLDGVLTSTGKAHFMAWKKMMKEHHILLEDFFEDELRGISRMESLDRILEYYEIASNYDDTQKQQMATIKNSYYNEMIDDYDEKDRYEGVVELLEALKMKSSKTALVSASKNAKKLIDKLSIEPYFDVIVDPESVERGKPYPDLFLRAARMLGCEPKDCVGVEDAAAGIQAIRKAGMHAVGIGDRILLKEADVVFSDIKSASEYILSCMEEEDGRY